ncbi:MAG: HD domain-containing protein [Gemmatimonadota bacterium]|nr:HD domain-containing protein [Gemmatimonadota bacterium]
MPYITHPANVALILARYGCEDDTIIAGILHDVVEDCEEHSREEHCRAIEAKFGATVLADVLTVTKPDEDSSGHPLQRAEKNAGYLAQVKRGTRRAMWVCAADKIHNANCVLNDLRRTEVHSTVWNRFSAPRKEFSRWYTDVIEALEETRFDEPIMEELRVAAAKLNQLAVQNDAAD